MTPAKLAPAGALIATLLAGCAWGPVQPLFTLTGQVVDERGAPVEGAVVSDGQAGVVTDAAGRFSLGVFKQRVAVIKPGFDRASTDVEAGRSATFRLSPAPAATRVAVDRRWSAESLGGIRLHLASEGHQVVDYAGGTLEGVDVLLMVTPGALGKTELERVGAWVRRGGRLILCGEWGGFPSQDLAGLNQLAAPAGIRFTGATVKTSQSSADAEWLTVGGVEPTALNASIGGDGLHLFTCTSLALDAGALPLLRSDRRAYSVLSRMGPQVLAAVGAHAYGKVFALGDSSLWLDEDSGQVGEPNWRRGANRRLASALIQW